MSSSGKRERTLPLYLRIGYSDEKKSGKVIRSFSGNKLLATGTQVTESESHRFDSKHGHYDGGGPFYTDRLQFKGSFPYLTVSKEVSGISTDFSGEVGVNQLSSTELTTLFGSALQGKRNEDTSDLDPYGASAISLCSPVNPVSGLSTGVSEAYREGLPSLPGIASWRRRTQTAKAAGSEFLNAEFGWLPLLSEVTQVRDAVRHHRDILNQYHRDEGKNVRRRFDFPISFSSATVDGIKGTPIFSNSEGGKLSSTAFNTQVGTWSGSVTRERTTKRWFSGAFTYGTPAHTDSWRRALGFGTDADKLFGIALSPDILWELTPWSWAVDWFTNTGFVINNITNFELAGQIMRYGYLMEESIDKVTQSYKNSGGSQVPAGRTITLTTERRSKVRRPANPFGFGLTGADLSPTQVLIAAALAITLV